MKKIQIKGKDYIEVNERIKEFHKKYPDGSITTDLIEKEDSTFINKTSALENCETSSVGRALGMLGIGIDTSVASYDEVANAIEQQKTPDAPPKVNLKDQEVPNPAFEQALDDLDGMPMDDDSSDWDGSEVVGFKSGKNVGKAYKELDFPSLEWIVNSCKVDSWKEKAKKEMKRRGA